MRARAHWPGGFPIRTRRIDEPLPSAPHVKSAPGEAIAGKAPAQILHENISTGRSDDDNTQNAAQPGRAESDRGDRVAEEVSESKPGTGPEQHTSELIEGEPAATHRDDAGQRRHDRGKPRHKFRDQHGPGAVVGKDILRLAHACVRLRRHPAELREHVRATWRPSSYQAKSTLKATVTTAPSTSRMLTW